MNVPSLVKTEPTDPGKTQEQDDLFAIKTQIAIAKYEQFVPRRPHDRKEEDGKKK